VQAAQGAEPYATDDKIGSLECTVGATYRIAPIDFGTLEYKHDSPGLDGSERPIGFTLVGSPPGVFIDTDTGEIQAQPTAAAAEQPEGVYTTQLVAVDASGAKFPLETITFVIKPQPKFILVTGNRDHIEGEVLSVPTKSCVTHHQAGGERKTVCNSTSSAKASDQPPFYPGGSYKIAPLSIAKDRTSVSSGSVDNITFTLSANAPDSFFVQATSGVIFGQFDEPKPYTFELLAIDAGGQQQVVEEYTFEVVIKPQPKFILVTGKRNHIEGEVLSVPTKSCVAHRQDGGERKTVCNSTSSAEASDQPPFYPGGSYKIAPLSIAKDRTSVSSGSVDNITFTLSANAPGSFFVQATSGVIFGQFDEAKPYTFELLAIDAEGQQQVVEEYTFEVDSKPDFTLATLGERAQTGAAFTDPTTQGSYIVADSYRLAPLALDEGQTQVSAGLFSELRYTLKGAPDSWFVNADNGETTGTFPSAGNYTFSLMAVDKGGQQAVVEDLAFIVVATAEFTVATLPNRTRSGDQFTNPTANTTFIVGQSYRIAPLTLDPSRTTVSSGAFSAITYTLDDQAPDGWFVNANSGEITGMFEEAREYTLTLFAVDSAGLRAAVEEYAFNVVVKPAFKVSPGWNPATMGTMQATPFPHREQPVYQLESTYAIPGPNVSAAVLFEAPSGGTEAISYAIECSARGGVAIGAGNSTIGSTPENGTLALASAAMCPGKFYVTKSGELLAQLTTVGNFVGILVAKDGAGATAVVKSWQFDVRPDDTAAASNGPNGQTCANGIAVDAIKFDDHFVCDCSATSFSGDNCEAAASPDAASRGVVAGLLSGFFAFILVATATVKYWQYTVMMRAHDFADEMGWMLKEAGQNEAEVAPNRAPREIKRKFVATTVKLGQGQFGEVFKALLDESPDGGVPGYAVAVKTSKEAAGEGADELLREAAVMAQVTGHPNLVSLVGVVTRGTPLMLVISICEGGSLHSRLDDGTAPGQPGKDVPPSLPHVIRMGLDIAQGLQHLVEHNYIHRDLAARNVLLDGAGACKVADFGLSRGAKAGGSDETYYRSSTGCFPVRWTAPEAMETMKFTHASDVWSWAVVVHEMFNPGKNPYSWWSNAETVTNILLGARAPQDNGCSEELYELMLRCWSDQPEDRPPFTDVIEMLTALSPIQRGSEGQQANDQEQLQAGAAGEGDNDSNYAIRGANSVDEAVAYAVMTQMGEDAESPVQVVTTAGPSSSGGGATPSETQQSEL
jgi:hypothetical protein